MPCRSPRGPVRRGRCCSRPRARPGRRTPNRGRVGAPSPANPKTHCRRRQAPTPRAAAKLQVTTVPTSIRNGATGQHEEQQRGCRARRRGSAARGLRSGSRAERRRAGRAPAPLGRRPATLFKHRHGRVADRVDASRRRRPRNTARRRGSRRTECPAVRVRGSPRATTPGHERRSPDARRGQRSRVAYHDRRRSGGARRKAPVPAFLASSPPRRRLGELVQRDVRAVVERGRFR